MVLEVHTKYLNSNYKMYNYDWDMFVKKTNEQFKS